MKIIRWAALFLWFPVMGITFGAILSIPYSWGPIVFGAILMTFIPTAVVSGVSAFFWAIGEFGPKPPLGVMDTFAGSGRGREGV